MYELNKIKYFVLMMIVIDDEDSEFMFIRDDEDGDFFFNVLFYCEEFISVVLEMKDSYGRVIC